jgi:hypothetical protein
MWQNRDSFPPDIGLGLMGQTAYVNDGGNDVVYFAGNYDQLWRYTVRDLNPANDLWEYVGRRTLSGKDGSGSAAFDPAQRILVKTLDYNSFGFWDVSAQATSRPANREIEIVPTLLSGTPQGDLRFYGMQHDPTLQGFVLWGGDANVWLLDPPDNLDPDGDGIKSLASGWTLRALNPSGTGPTIPGSYTGVFGKWVYLPNDQAYLGVIDPVAGDVYVYKPPYNGSSPTVQGLLTGAVDYIVDGTASHVSLIKSGQLRALAKLNSRPLATLPDVQPLSVEAANQALDDISTWVGFVAPAGAPRAIVDKIQREIATMYSDPAIAQTLEKSGISAVSSTPEEFDAFLRKETDRWGKVFKESGIQLN